MAKAQYFGEETAATKKTARKTKAPRAAKAKRKYIKRAKSAQLTKRKYTLRKNAKTAPLGLVTIQVPASHAFQVGLVLGRLAVSV